MKRVRADHGGLEGAERRRSTNLYYLYGITLFDFKELLELQNGECATCPIKAVDHHKEFVVDHDHKCCPGLRSCGDCVRGLLCNNCNTAIGMVKENADTLIRMASYIGF